MKLKTLLLFIMLSVSAFFLSGCFPTYKAARMNLDSLSTIQKSKSQAKVFKKDNTIILFPDGFSVENKIIKGNIILPEKNFSVEGFEISTDSIIAMITYDNSTSAGRAVGSFLFGVSAPVMTALGIYCISCPKCCFGSCPTVYVHNGTEYHLQSELFSQCISRQLESRDIDLLVENITDTTLKIKITNEALETHFINKFEVIAAEHPKGATLYTTINNDLTLTSKPASVISAFTKEGLDVINEISGDDDDFYRSGVDKITELKKGPVYDYIDLKLPASKNSKPKLLLKYRNTLLSTTLLYDVVIGSQGAAGLAWTEKMNEDAAYASQFKMVYDAFSGIRIKLFRDNEWMDIGKFPDAGPLNWKYIAAEFPESLSDTLLIRLEFVPDNFMIDYAGTDTSSFSANEITTKIIHPFEVTDGYGKISDSLLTFTDHEDDYYLRTEPGDCYYLNYNISHRVNYKTSALVLSKGYYNEWIRGSWISEKDNNYSFNLYDIQGTLSRLADSWTENCDILEREFFHSKFSLKEKL